MNTTEQQPLTTQEREDLARLEKLIDERRGAFRECAKALLEVRTRRLWREDFRSFEHFVSERLQISKWTAGALVTAGWVITLCEAEGLPGPSSLRQARNIARVLDVGMPRGRPSNKPTATPRPPAAAPDRLANLREILESSSPSGPGAYEKLHQVAAGRPVDRPPASEVERRVRSISRYFAELQISIRVRRAGASSSIATNRPSFPGVRLPDRF